MHTPAARAAGAAFVLIAYYVILFASPYAGTDVDESDAQLRRDIEQSRQLFDARQFNDALAPTQRVAEAMPTQALYHDRLAQIFIALERPAEAARAWEQVMTVSATPIDACPMIAEAYQRAGEVEASIAAWRRCASLPPHNPDFELYLGQALLRSDRKAEARQAFERGIAVDAAYPDLHLLLGVRQFDDGENAAALKSFERFLELAPERRDEVDPWIARAKGSL